MPVVGWLVVDLSPIVTRGTWDYRLNARCVMCVVGTIVFSK